MKTPLAICLSITVLATGSLAPVFAQDERQPLADDIETSDQLIRSVDPSKRNRQYGEKDIYISGEGAKQNQLVTPDALEQSLDTQTQAADTADTRKDVKLKPREVTEEDKAIETPDRLLRTLRKNVTGGGNKNRNDLVTPDPLMDNVN
ncbi:hypothetical protein MNBD_GAMMA13-2010 [hydrothermal vent metagenome]|uniref:Uncharacterized protein n=1 Tax=hydrothermal vent metagenome TaxID=652676 RepID=A0A3B0ZPJ8_9ZZZZ